MAVGRRVRGAAHRAPPRGRASCAELGSSRSDQRGRPWRAVGGSRGRRRRAAPDRPRVRRRPPERASAGSSSTPRQVERRGEQPSDRRPGRRGARSPRSCRASSDGACPDQAIERAISRNQCATVERHRPVAIPTNPSRAARTLDLPEPLVPRHGDDLARPRVQAEPVEYRAGAASHVEVGDDESRVEERRRGRRRRRDRRGPATRPAGVTASIASGRDAVGVTPPLRGVQQVEHVVRRGDPFGRGVELHADLAQRQVRLGREQQHEQPRREGEVAVRPAGTRSRRRRSRPRCWRGTRARSPTGTTTRSTFIVPAR